MSFLPSPIYFMNSSGTVVCGGLICLASLVVQRLNSDELVVNSVIAPLLAVLLITFSLMTVQKAVLQHAVLRGSCQRQLKTNPF